MTKDMRIIYKYPTVSRIFLPEGYKVLKAGLQNGTIFVWIELDKDREEVFAVQFMEYGTGMEIHDNPGIYIDSIFQEEFVWHVYYIQNVIEKD